ncbi:MAG: hypothetical protein IKU71_08685, partial [Kiritimatiellae bacterium]|nr:hypothetical protein [Kiritimatiellia bacterium]
MATEGMDKDQAFDDAAYDGGSELARRLPDLYAEYEQWQESEEGQNEGANFYEWLDHEHYDELREFLDNPSEEWWDRQDESHIGHDGLMEIAGAKGGIRYSIGGIYTGSAADYEKPSLHHVGTGEGSQVYGWGLYGSTVRGIAEGYGRGDVFAKKRPTRAGHFEINGKRLPEWVSDRLLEFDEDGSTYFDGGKPDVNFLIKGLKDEGVIHGHKDAAEILKQVEANREGLRFVSETEGNLYEQTFFTNRKPGDESHLLKWYDEISDANWDRVIAQAEKEGLRDKLKGAWWLRFNGDLEHFITDNGNSGDAIYERLSKLLGTPQAASEFLARAGIDGVKYPVDSYGKTLKDGDAAGWNYVSFRDDNISVDHKWTDGQRRYSITTLGKYNTDDLRDLAHRVKDGDSAAIADAGRRLAKILPKNAVLVPMPSRTGEPTTMRALSDAIAANADGATVVDALRSNPHESSYERKKRGDEPEEVEMRRVAEIPKGREVYVVDNVIDTGAMYHAAMRTIHDAHLLALADTDKTPAELRQTIAQNIDHILSRFDAAKGLSKKDIFAKFDNRQLEIGWLPSDLALPDELQVAKRSVMGAEAFILDHIHNKPGHEKQLTADDARRMLANIDPNNEMRVVPQRGSLSLAFIAPNPANGWDCTVIAPHGGALYVFKTMFGQTRKPYQDKSLIRYSVSVRRNEAADRLIRGGLSSIRDFSETPRSISQSGAPAQGGRFSVSAPAVADPDVQVAKESAEQRYSVFAGEKTAAPRLLKPLAEAKAMLGDGEYTDAVRREIYDKTGWWRGTDGKWRVELPNLKPKYFDADESVDFADSDLLLEKYGWDEYSAYWLRDLVTFPKGLKANTYELGETLVFFVDEEQMKSASGGEDASAATFVRVEQGLFGPQVTCEIHVVDPMVEDRERNGRQRLAQSTLDSITHELQHVIQLREGFAFGGNMTDAGSD